MVFLAVGVAARETPEILELTDDMSNEGMVVDYEDSLAELTSLPLCLCETPQPTLGRFSALVNLSKKRSRFSPSLNASSQSGKEILHFLSIQRK